MVDFIDRIIMFFQKFWWAFVIGGLVILVFYFYNKWKKSQIKYHNQIEENRKLWIKEIQFNPTEIKKLKWKNRTYKVYGEIFHGIIKVNKSKPEEQIGREWTPYELRLRELAEIEAGVKKAEMPEHFYYTYACKYKTFLGLFFVGDYEIVSLEFSDFERVKVEELVVNGSISLVYYKGTLIPMRLNMFDFVDENSQRVMADLTVNATGNQQKTFSKIENTYAHAEVMKDKEIEQEKEKKKSVAYG